MVLLCRRLGGELLLHWFCLLMLFMIPQCYVFLRGTLCALLLLDVSCFLNYEGHARQVKLKRALLPGLAWLVLSDWVIRGCAGRSTSSGQLTYSVTDLLGLRHSRVSSLPGLLNDVPRELLRCIINKMAKSMAAVLRAPRKLCSFLYVLFVILLFYVLDVVSITVYDRHMLLNIGSFIAQRKLDFEFLVRRRFVYRHRIRALCLGRTVTTEETPQEKEKRAGVFVILRHRPLRPPLPTILLANFQSLDNKLCELRVRISYQ